MSQRARRFVAVLLLVTGLVWSPMAVAGQTESRTPAKAAPAKNGTSVKSASTGTWSASTKKGEWPHYTGDLTGARYSPLDQINADNFNKLEVAWRFKTDSLGTRPEYTLEGTPLMVNRVLYTTAGTRRAV